MTLIKREVRDYYLNGAGSIEANPSPEEIAGAVKVCPPFLDSGGNEVHFYLGWDASCPA